MVDSVLWWNLHSHGSFLVVGGDNVVNVEFLCYSMYLVEVGRLYFVVTINYLTRE